MIITIIIIKPQSEGQKWENCSEDWKDTVYEHTHSK